jgi:hypothetical protein
MPFSSANQPTALFSRHSPDETMCEKWKGKGKKKLPVQDLRMAEDISHTQEHRGKSYWHVLG